MNILLRDFNAKLTRDAIFKPTGNDRLHANINGNAGAARNLGTMFQNQNIPKLKHIKMRIFFLPLSSESSLSLILLTS